MLSEKKLLVVISAPSGTGKTTVIEKLFESIKGIEKTISYTTRPKKDREVDKKDYFFISKKEFEEKIKRNEFIEYANVHGYLYGTSKHFLSGRFDKDLILNIDVQGGCNVKKKFPEAILIFLLPPSFEELENRLIKRKRDTKKEIEKRINNAKEEIKYLTEYDYVVVNDKIKDAVKKIIEIIRKHRKGGK